MWLIQINAIGTSAGLRSTMADTASVAGVVYE
jgi:hypothetical protein